MITALLIIHGLVAVTLLGAITHQAAALLWTSRSARKSFVEKYGSVQPASFTNAIIVLYILAFVLGCFLYPPYRIDVRIVLEDLGLKTPTGIFEIKEHVAALGLGLLPAYWYYWKESLPDVQKTRTMLTVYLALSVWYSFLVGHILNNLRGFG